MDDNLLAHGPQLTWMDAAIDNRFITPREGKAVEIQALWYNSLRIMELLAQHFNEMDNSQEFGNLAEQAKESFNEQFWDLKHEYLLDTIQENQRDSTLRPNQLIAIALDFSMLGKEKAERVVEVVWKELWGIYGLRTLSQSDKRYLGKYLGGPLHRDSAYHNGTVWGWLIGPFVTAFLKTRNHEKQWRDFAFKEFLAPLFQQELYQAGLGTISEIFDGDPPHRSRGCVTQAWSVAEPLRAFIEDVAFRRPPFEEHVHEGLR
jgi:glycogen debranching enzyme